MYVNIKLSNKIKKSNRKRCVYIVLKRECCQDMELEYAPFNQIFIIY